MAKTRKTRYSSKTNYMDAISERDRSRYYNSTACYEDELDDQRTAAIFRYSSCDGEAFDIGKVSKYL